MFASAVAIAPLAGCGPAAPRYEKMHNPSTTNGHVRGRALSHSGDPVQARVTLEPGSFVTVSDANGHFAINDVPGGEYDLYVSGAKRQKIRVRAGHAVFVEIEQDKPPKLDPRHMAKPYGAPPARQRVV